MSAIRRLVAAGLVLAAPGLATEALAQDADHGATIGRVIGTGAVTGFVEDMDRSLAFYHAVLGMEVPPLPASGMRPYNPSNAQLFAMFDIPGARERHQHARVPDTDVGFELMEIRDVEHRTIPLRLQDPGAMTLVFSVRSVDAVRERAMNAGAGIVTEGGMPVTLADGSRALMIRDVDGRFVEFREPPAATGQAAPAGPGIMAMRLSIAVADVEQTTEVYREVLGFTVDEVPDERDDPALRTLTGLSDAVFRRSVVVDPAGKLRIEFVEYGAVDRKPLDMRIQDRGAARLQIRAENLEALVERLGRAGFRIVSAGGAPVPIPPNFMGALVADPNNFFLTPFAPCDGCAPRLVPETR